MSTLKIPVADLLRQKGLKPTVQQLVKMGMGRVTANQLLYRKPASIKFADLLRLCLFLNCTPNDVLVLEMNDKETLPPKHPMQKLLQQKLPMPIQELKLLNPNQLQQVSDLIMKLSKE